jgi:hypothetical protein
MLHFANNLWKKLLFGGRGSGGQQWADEVKPGITNNGKTIANAWQN